MKGELVFHLQNTTLRNNKSLCFRHGPGQAEINFCIMVLEKKIIISRRQPADFQKTVAYLNSIPSTCQIGLAAFFQQCVTETLFPFDSADIRNANDFPGPSVNIGRIAAKVFDKSPGMRNFLNTFCA